MTQVAPPLTTGQATRVVAPAAPGQFTRRAAVIGAALALTAGAAAAVSPRRHERTLGSMKLADALPRSVGRWRDTPTGAFVLPEGDQPTSFYDQVLSRTFGGEGLPTVMMLIAYGAAQSGLMKVHRPEVCYASAGFNIIDLRPADVRLNGGQTITGEGFVARRDTRTEPVLYWTRISDAFPRDLTHQRLVMLERGVQGIIPDGVLVRLSTIGDDVAAGHAVLTQFAQQLVESASSAGRSLLIGALKPRGG